MFNIFLPTGSWGYPPAAQFPYIGHHTAANMISRQISRQPGGVNLTAGDLAHHQPIVSPHPTTDGINMIKVGA